MAKPKYVYVKVKVGQGLWWAPSSKPSIWYLNAIKKGSIKYDLVGRPEAEVLSVKKYQVWGSNQFDSYVTLKLKVSYNKRLNVYYFNRSSLSIGSAIDLQFPAVDITGTVIQISREPIKERYVDKIVYLTYQGGYTMDSPFKYEEIKVGDSYFDGERIVFKVLDKYLEKRIMSVPNNLTGSVYQSSIDTVQNIVVKAKVTALQKEDGLYYDEEYKLATNFTVPFTTTNYFFQNFVVRQIE